VDDCPEAAGRGDRLQARDSGAEGDHLGRLYAAGGRGQHRQENVERPCAFDHGRIAGDSRLGRQDIHCLRASGARQPFEAEVLQCSCGHGSGDVLVTATERDDHGSRLEAREVGRRAHAKDDTGRRNDC
jgi:hypothetical protein